MAIHLNDEQGTHTLDLERLHQWAQVITTAVGLSDDSEWSLSFVDEAAIQALNLDFRGIDAPTDVLSFPMGDDDAPMIVPGGGQLLGDVVIAPAIADGQARERGHTFEAELALLMAHGLLHLLGHDHDTPENKARMWAIQDELLARLGVVVRDRGDG